MRYRVTEIRPGPDKSFDGFGASMRVRFLPSWHETEDWRRTVPEITFEGDYAPQVEDTDLGTLLVGPTWRTMITGIDKDTIGYDDNAFGRENVEGSRLIESGGYPIETLIDVQQTDSTELSFQANVSLTANDCKPVYADALEGCDFQLEESEVTDQLGDTLQEHMERILGYELDLETFNQFVEDGICGSTWGDCAGVQGEFRHAGIDRVGVTRHAIRFAWFKVLNYLETSENRKAELRIELGVEPSNLFQNDEGEEGANTPIYRGLSTIRITYSLEDHFWDWDNAMWDANRGTPILYDGPPPWCPERSED
jgi:hypothetical protein